MCERFVWRSHVFGDYSLVPTGVCRIGGDGESTQGSDHIAAHFDSVYSDYCELMQHDYTFRCLAREATGPSLYPTLWGGVKVQVAVKGILVGSPLQLDIVR